MAVFDMKSKWHVVSSVFDVMLNHLLISLHQLNGHDFDLKEGQVFPNTISGSTAENHAHQLLLLLVVSSLPPLGDELERVFEYFRLVEDAHPMSVDKSSFPDPNSPNQCVLCQLPSEAPWNHSKLSLDLENDALEIL